MMKSFVPLIVLWLIAASALSGKLAAQVPEVFAFRPGVSPVDNPLKGLVPYQAPSADRFPHSMEFSYLGLAKLVRGDGQYDFAELESLLDDVKSRGNQTVFRIMLEYPGQKNLIPQYLIDGGLVVHKYKNTNMAPLPPKNVETPDYENPALRKCLQDFVAEMGRRYDGDPRIAYITAGLLGTWGEWHTYPREDLWASKKVQVEILEAYQKAFSKTPILLRYPAGKDHYDKAATVNYPFGYHDDSFAYATMPSDKQDEDWYYGSLLKQAGIEDVWQKHAIGGEIRPEVWGCCFDAEPCTPAGQSFAACRDFTHVTWLMDSGMFENKAEPERYKNAVNQVRKMGYDFYVSQASVKRKGTKAAELVNVQIELTIVNQGVAPFYHPNWPIHLAAIDTKTAKVIQQWPTSAHLNHILPNSPPAKPSRLQFNLSIPESLANQTLAIGVPNPMPGGKPLRFANQNQDLHVPGWLSIVNE